MTMDRSILRGTPWHIGWRLSTRDETLAAILVALALLLLLLAIIPQIPDDPLAADQWLAQVRSRFGPATGLMYRLGFFSLSEAFAPRLLLGLAAFVLLVRAAQRSEALWREGSSSQQTRWVLSSLLAHLGPILFLLGLLVGHLWGWQAEAVITQEQHVVRFGEQREIVVQKTDAGLQSTEPGVLIHTTGSGPQLTVRAYDAEGDRLGLQRTSREATSQELTLPLTGNAPEGYFAVPEVDIVVRARASAAGGERGSAPVLIQVFRAPTGEIVQQMELGEEEKELTVDGARLEIARTSYTTVAVIHDPGRWLNGIGLLVTVAGLLALLTTKRDTGREEERVASLALRLMLALTTLVVAGAGLRDWAEAGTIWNPSPLQLGLTALWLLGLAAWLGWQRPGTRWLPAEEAT